MVKQGEIFAVPLLIEMKGHPGTGKTTLARSLASSLKIPLIDKDDVRDCNFLLQNSALSPPPITNLLNDLSCRVIWQIVSTQLRLGLSAIIDSPLSRKTHLDRLVHLASSAGARVVIVECKPVDEAEWSQRLESRAACDEASWHKPSTWRDLDTLLEGYDGCTDYDVGNVQSRWWILQRLMLRWRKLFQGYWSSSSLMLIMSVLTI